MQFDPLGRAGLRGRPSPAAAPRPGRRRTPAGAARTTAARTPSRASRRRGGWRRRTRVQRQDSRLHHPLVHLVNRRAQPPHRSRRQLFCAVEQADETPPVAAEPLRDRAMSRRRIGLRFVKREQPDEQRDRVPLANRSTPRAGPPGSSPSRGPHGATTLELGQQHRLARSGRRDDQPEARFADGAEAADEPVDFGPMDRLEDKRGRPDLLGLARAARIVDRRGPRKGQIGFGAKQVAERHVENLRLTPPPRFSVDAGCSRPWPVRSWSVMAHQPGRTRQLVSERTSAARLSALIRSPTLRPSSSGNTHSPSVGCRVGCSISRTALPWLRLHIPTPPSERCTKSLPQNML